MTQAGEVLAVILLILNFVSVIFGFITGYYNGWHDKADEEQTEREQTKWKQQ